MLEKFMPAVRDVDLLETDLTDHCNRLHEANAALQEKVRAQQRLIGALQESEERYRELVELAPDAIITLDMRGRVYSTNGSNCGIHGYTADEVVGKPFWKLDVFRAQDIPKYLRLFVSLLRGKRMTPIELVCLSKDGTESVIECRASIMRRNGRVAGLQLIARNITELRTAEQALRESEHILRATLESAADGLLVVMEGGVIKHFNERFVQMWNIPSAMAETGDRDLFLQHGMAQIHDPQAFIARVREIHEKPVSVMDVLRFKDGRVFERFSCPLVCNGRVGGRVLSYRDVTEKRQAERLAAIGEMTAGLAHESRNAMQRMQACLEMLALEVQDRPEALDLLGRMQAAQDRLHHLHEEVRHYAAPIMLDCQSVELDCVAREAWQHLESARSGRIIHFRCSVKGESLRLDRLAMEGVFRNIFENSLAACSDPVEIEVRSRPASLSGRPAVEIAVGDNGPGLGPQGQLRIFEPFYTTKTQGTGLGMAISQRLVEAHGGRISAREAPAGGAEIVITLPRP